MAISTMLLGLLAALSLFWGFWGFWQLEHAVSMSPIETACALAGTVLSPLSGDVRMVVEEFLGVVGQRMVKRTVG